MTVDTPPSVNSSEYLAYLQHLQPDILLVASFGEILAPQLLKIPQRDCVNIHPSILPRHRGPSPMARPMGALPPLPTAHLRKIFMQLLVSRLVP